MTFRWLMLIGAVATATCCGAGAAEDMISTSSVYRVENGHVIIPEWDSRPLAPKPLMEIGTGGFPGGFVYRDRLLLGDAKPIVSTAFEVPENATTFTITARSRPAGDIFPRLRISLITSDSNQHELFEGYWQTVALETYKWELDEYVRGKKARLHVEMLNPGVVEEQRTWYFLRANVY